MQSVWAEFLTLFCEVDGKRGELGKDEMAWKGMQGTTFSTHTITALYLVSKPMGLTAWVSTCDFMEFKKTHSLERSWRTSWIIVTGSGSLDHSDSCSLSSLNKVVKWPQYCTYLLIRELIWKPGDLSQKWKALSTWTWRITAPHSGP